MRKLMIFSFALALFAVSAVVWAAAPDGVGPWADEVVSFTQGDREDGSSVAVDRSDPNNALGVAENVDAINFTALGYGGELVLKFENSIYNGDGNDLRVVETTYNNSSCENYPERVKVDVSVDGQTWYNGGEGCQDFELDLGDLDLECIQYVRMTDITNPDEFNVNHITDGYDVDGVMALNSREGNCGYTYQCTDGALYLDSNGQTSSLYLLDTTTGNADWKKTYDGDFQNTLAADQDGNVFAIDRGTLKLMQLMSDGTTVEVAQTDLPKSEGTLTIAPDNTMYIALNDERLYSVNMTTGASTLLVDLTADSVDVQGGDIVVDENNLMVIINTSGQVWSVDLSDGYTVASYGDLGNGTFTGMTYIDGVYYVTERDNDKLHKFMLGGPMSVVGALNVNTNSGDAASCAPARLNADINIVKSADLDLLEVFMGEVVSYTYNVTNTGELPLNNVSVVDDKCSPVDYVSGDTNNDSKLDIDETWVYTCSQALYENTTNVGTASGDDPFGDTVTDSSEAVTVVVKEPGCTLTQGYWKNHYTGSKHADTNWEGRETYTLGTDNELWIDILNTPPKKGNAWTSLAHQFIAANLNRFSAYAPQEVIDALDTAFNDYLSNYSSEVGPGKKGAEKADRQAMIELADILADYNEGNIGPGHCSDN